ncbi:MAG: hypothetical protein ACFCBW_10170 [Candidatus Competibacterales bacterium]
MKKRHYLLIALAALAVTYLQPVMALIGGVVFIAGVAALIYADMTPQGQAAFERRVSGFLTALKENLKGERGRAAASLARGDQDPAQTDHLRWHYDVRLEDEADPRREKMPADADRVVDAPAVAAKGRRRGRS